MAPAHEPSNPSLLQPHRTIFDPWNSSSTGHQRAESRLAGSTSWRASRTMKLASQFKAGSGGGRRLCDSVGAGSEMFGKDGRKENGGWEEGAPGAREKGWQDVRGLLNKPGSKEMWANDGQGEDRHVPTITERVSPKVPEGSAEAIQPKSLPALEPNKKIFDGLCIFINGSTLPTIGDHRLKQVLAENGARISIALARRSVTHVILGTAAGPSAGGGLAAGKIQKEIQRVGGKGLKYVRAEWVLASLKAGKRLSEAQFSNMVVTAKDQKSVYGMFHQDTPGTTVVPKSDKTHQRVCGTSNDEHGDQRHGRSR